MLITFHCGKCDSRLEIEAAHAGTRIPCPSCQTPVEVPAAVIGPGTTIGGFRIERLIGEGGMGRVFLARQLSMDRPVALKILPAAMAADPGIVERFVQEVRLSAKLDHAHLVTAYEAGQDDGVLFFAMAYVNGRTLHDRLRAEGPLTEEAALRITHKLAHALAYAWTEHRLLHRDIKPANILLDARGEPKLADLGLARSLEGGTDGRTAPGAIMGTPNYMSPEAAEGRPLDPRSDIYSLGATLWSMLTGQIPFDGEPVNAVLRKQVSEPLPPVTRWNPSVSPETVALLNAMLEKDPRRRVRTWEELIARIEALLLRRTLEPPRAPPMAPLVLLFAALLLVAGAAIWATLRARARARATPPTAAAGVFPDSEPSPTTPTAPPEPSPPEASPTEAHPTPRPIPPEAALLQAARAYWREHPEDRAGAIRRLREVMRRHPDSPAARQAAEQADRLERMPGPAARGLDALMNRWRREADEAMARGDFEEIVRRWKKYSGPFAAETAEWRADRVARAEEAIAQRERNDAQRKSELDAEISAAAALLLRGDPAGAAGRLKSAAQNDRWRPWKAEIEALANAAAAAPDRAARLQQTFRALAGQKTELELRDATIEDAMVLSAGPSGVVIRQWLPEGFADREVAYTQLHLREIWRRLGPDSDPQTRLARGLLAAELGQWTAAAEQFGAAEGPLAALLAGEARRRAAAAAPR
mgnify:CR=1 FL=1